LAPVIRLAAGLARKTTARATSSGVPMRPIAHWASAPSYMAGMACLIISQFPPSK